MQVSLDKNVNDILQALNSTPGASPDLRKKKALELQLQLDEILNVKFNRRTYKAKPGRESASTSAFELPA